MLPPDQWRVCSYSLRLLEGTFFFGYRPLVWFAQFSPHYEKSYTGMNVFRKGINSFRNGMNMFRTGMKTFWIGTGIRGNQNCQKIRNFSGSKNLKEFFQNSNFLDLVWFGMSFLKPWNFEKILSDSYSPKNF